MLLNRTLAPGLILPHYGGYNVSNVLPTALKHFGQKAGTPLADGLLPPDASEAEKIIMFVVDGLGYEQFRAESARGHAPNVSKLHLNPITSAAPTATTANLCTFVTGVPPAVHGFVGYKSELLRRWINPNSFKLGPGAKGEKLTDIGLRPSDIRTAPLGTKQLADAGVNLIQYIRRDYMVTPLSNIIYEGTQLHDYLNRADFLVHSRHRLQQAKGKTFAFLYWDMVDVVSHMHGALSDVHAAEVRALDFGIQTELLEPLDGTNTLFLLTADHGHINRNPERMTNLAADEKLMSFLEWAPQGDVREGRLDFIYTKPGKQQQAKAHLEKNYGEDCMVITAEEALKIGLFGATDVLPEIRRRLGDLILIAKDDALLGSRPIPEMMQLVGYHGGLHRQEMLVPLIAKML